MNIIGIESVVYGVDVLSEDWQPRYVDPAKVGPSHARS